MSGGDIRSKSDSDTVRVGAIRIIQKRSSFSNLKGDGLQNAYCGRESTRAEKSKSEETV